MLIWGESIYTIRSRNYSRLNQTLIGCLITALDAKLLSPQSACNWPLETFQIKHKTIASPLSTLNWHYNRIGRYKTKIKRFDCKTYIGSAGCATVSCADHFEWCSHALLYFWKFCWFWRNQPQKNGAWGCQESQAIEVAYELRSGAFNCFIWRDWIVECQEI